MCDCRVCASNMQRPSFTSWMEGAFLDKSVEGRDFDTASCQDGAAVLRKEGTREPADLRVTRTQGESRHSSPGHWNSQFRRSRGDFVHSTRQQSLRLKTGI